MVLIVLSAKNAFSARSEQPLRSDPKTEWPTPGTVMRTERGALQFEGAATQF